MALAKSQPGKLNYAVRPGTGGSLHLGGELLKMSAGINMAHVPYKGAALALTDVIGGHVDSMFISAPGAIGRSGRQSRVLAVASARRRLALPDAPTFVGARLPDVEVDSRYGMIAPAAMPAATFAGLGAIAKALGRLRYASNTTSGSSHRR